MERGGAGRGGEFETGGRVDRYERFELVPDGGVLGLGVCVFRVEEVGNKLQYVSWQLSAGVTWLEVWEQLTRWVIASESP